MEIYHISAECYPVAKVGGLADVVGALPKYQNSLGHKARVIVPKYDTKFNQENEFETLNSGKLKLGLFEFQYEIQKEKTNFLGFELIVISIPGLFDRPNVYSYEDDTERFLAFQIALLNWITETKQQPDVINCHDHHTGLIPFMVQFCHDYSALKEISTVLTIHNAQYQGWFSFDKVHYIPEFNKLKIGFLEWNNCINPLATGIKAAWKVTTVSPSYLDEMSHSANGLEDLLRHERPKSIGILNGIDNELWNPKTDAMLDVNYDVSDFKNGKSQNKQLLCKQFNLDSSKPLFAFIGRLVDEKGADLLPEICNLALLNHSNQLNIFILGSGNPDLEGKLQEIKTFHHQNYNVCIGYNEKVAHQVYASADFLLMPSRVEPCGLNQMYSLRYGTIPIVRKTGGLKDTIIDINNHGFGICHDEATVSDVILAISRAMKLYKEIEKLDEAIITSMQIDHSWNKAATEYITVYKSLKQH